MNGDIDYAALFGYLTEQRMAPHFVLEQAVEAHRRGRAELGRVLS